MRVRESCRGGRAGRNSLRFAGATPAATTAFTLIELLVVIAVIIVLAGLVLSTVGYVQKKGARSRAETEIAAMSAASESYKADNGIYPLDPATNTLNARTMGDPVNTNATDYKSASLYLYTQLSGNDSNRQPRTNAKSYFAFKPNQLSPADQSLNVEFIRDPFGNSYGYSTANQADPAKGYNPTFDLWSTAGLTAAPGGTPDTITPQWIKNW